jgi:hypothetical protein
MLDIKRTNNLINKGAKELNRHFSNQENSSQNYTEPGAGGSCL